MKAINKSLVITIISAIFFTIIFIAIVALIVRKVVIEGSIYNTYQDQKFMIDFNPKISKTLDKLSDIEGLNSSYSYINITNNNKNKRKYQILLTPINSDEKDIRVSLSNTLIKDLSSFDKNNNNYILGEFSLESGYSNIHQIRIWQKKDSNIDKIKINFKVKVNILKE